MTEQEKNEIIEAVLVRLNATAVDLAMAPSVPSVSDGDRLPLVRGGGLATVYASMFKPTIGNGSITENMIQPGAVTLRALSEGAVDSNILRAESVKEQHVSPDLRPLVFNPEYPVMPFGGTVSGVSPSQTSVIGDVKANIVLDTARRVFLYRTSGGWYANNWTGADAYMDSGRTSMLPYRLFYTAGKLYMYDSIARTLRTWVSV